MCAACIPAQSLLSTLAPPLAAPPRGHARKCLAPASGGSQRAAWPNVACVIYPGNKFPKFTLRRRAVARRSARPRGHRAGPPSPPRRPRRRPRRHPERVGVKCSFGHAARPARAVALSHRRRHIPLARAAELPEVAAHVSETRGRARCRRPKRPPFCLSPPAAPAPPRAPVIRQAALRAARARAEISANVLRDAFDGTHLSSIFGPGVQRAARPEQMCAREWKRTASRRHKGGTKTKKKRTHTKKRDISSLAVLLPFPLAPPLTRCIDIFPLPRPFSSRQHRNQSRHQHPMQTGSPGRSVFPANRLTDRMTAARTMGRRPHCSITPVTSARISVLWFHR